METWVIAALTVTALCAGTIDAIAGGGGLITLPALLTAGLPPHVALGTNKGQSVWGSGAAMIEFFRAGRVDGRQAAFTFPLGLCGSVLGAQLVLLVDKALLRPLVIALLIGAAVLLLVRKPSRDDDVPGGRPWIAAALALGIGAYDGFFGPGTGTFLIVGFVTLCGRSLVHATADAKVVNFASNLAALGAFAAEGNVVWQVALPMGAAQLVGGVLGARLAMQGGARLIRVVVVLVSGALVAKLAYDLVS
ncbi:MAG: TSUP family transporter [Kofleriaceae bacterium]|nr:TSUP family transporter [Kofleriaceae bacterium]